VTDAGKRLRRGARLWTVAVSTFKAETYRHLGLPRPTKEELAEGVQYPPGTVHLPDWVDSEWLKQLVAEELVTVRTKRGFARLEWQKLRERNEALDCRVYARAAAWIVGADRWSEARRFDLETQVAGESNDALELSRILRHFSGRDPQVRLRLANSMPSGEIQITSVGQYHVGPSVSPAAASPSRRCRAIATARALSPCTQTESIFTSRDLPLVEVRHPRRTMSSTRVKASAGSQMSASGCLRGVRLKLSA